MPFDGIKESGLVRERFRNRIDNDFEHEYIFINYRY